MIYFESKPVENLKLGSEFSKFDSTFSKFDSYDLI